MTETDCVCAKNVRKRWEEKRNYVTRFKKRAQICTSVQEEDTRCCAVRLHTRNRGGNRSDTRKKKKQLGGVSSIRACSHQRPERHAQRGLRDDGPVLHVEPLRADCASFVSSSRNSNRMTLRSPLHTESSRMWTRIKQKRSDD